jgi:hypothetical protein
MTAILREEPADLAPAAISSSTVAPGLARIVGHCLEKNPGERFQSASDIAFALEALSGSTAVSAAAPAVATSAALSSSLSGSASSRWQGWRASWVADG